jgi:hypothetical protein
MAEIKSNRSMADQQLPIGLVRKLGGWSAQAQSYPVFSPTWFRYRALSMILPMMVFAVILAATAIFSVEVAHEQPEMPPVWLYLSLVATWLAYVLLVFGGRWLAKLVYRRHWSAKKEAVGVVVAILFGIVFATAVYEGTDYYGDKWKDSFVKEQEKTVKANLTSPDPDSLKSAEKREKEAQSRKAKEDAGRWLGRGIWAIMVAWLGGIFDLVAYFRQRRALRNATMQQELDEAKEKRNEAEMRLSVLAAQIEPHFLFNTLAGVRSAIRNDPTRGIVIIDHLVEYLRATIPQMRNEANAPTVLLESQLNAARAYLGVMSARLPRLSFSVDCAPDLLTLPVPPLMLISLVENAVKHGIEPKLGAARIEVLAHKFSNASGEYIELSVSDDGVGFSAATSGSGIGLANIRERLAQLYGTKAQLNLKARPQGGVVASIVLPLETTPA